MVSMMNKELLRTIKFTVFSISAGVIQFGVFALLYDLLNLPYWPSYLTGLVLSVIWNFTLNRNFTFNSANNVPKAMFQVFLFYLVFTPVSTYLGNTLESSGWNGNIVTLLMMVTNFVTEYLYDRFYVFKDSIDTKVK
ncbi:MAG: GtrA family protein [Bacilli bacterium]|nr:GtrA family protein [Bacilli bacterium]